MMSERMITIAALALLICLIRIAGPESSSACSVCIDPNADSRRAFAVTATVLSLLPLTLVGGTLVFLRRAAQQR